MEKYSLNKVEQTTQAIKLYVTACMKEMNLGQQDLRSYTRAIRNYDFNYVLQISQEYIDMLNKMKEAQQVKITYIQ